MQKITKNLIAVSFISLFSGGIARAVDSFSFRLFTDRPIILNQSFPRQKVKFRIANYHGPEEGKIIFKITTPKTVTSNPKMVFNIQNSSATNIATLDLRANKFKDTQQNLSAIMNFAFRSATQFGLGSGPVTVPITIGAKVASSRNIVIEQLDDNSFLVEGSLEDL